MPDTTITLDPFTRSDCDQSNGRLRRVNSVHTENGNTRVHLFIVDLSDGKAWDVAPVAEAGVTYNWGAPAAVTCDEVFAPMQDNLRRVRLGGCGVELGLSLSVKREPHGGPSGER